DHRGGRSGTGRWGGPGKPKGTGKREKRCDSWFGVHRDIAVVLTAPTSRVLWLRGVKPGFVQTHLKRFTVPGLPRVWRPDDFVTAFDLINKRQGRYSPGSNRASMTREDRNAAAAADAGAIGSPIAILQWYLDQLDPVNDHPRFHPDGEDHKARWIGRREAVAAENAEIAATGRALDGRDRAAATAAWAAEARRQAGLPAQTSPRNRHLKLIVTNRKDGHGE
ncbi:hypothetical protein, partial [Acrocarpospora pleiomorpha]|uniref:hypothetical protein n=1 Tax=Acrocarpospora pleiomorpha TaxID=90975 RepID=UPI0031D06F44